MSNLNAPADLQELIASIRGLINYPKRLNELFEDKPVWNMLTSALDVVSDTEYAIVSYGENDYEHTGVL